VARRSEGWKLRWKNGAAYVRFTHEGQRHEVSTGERDPARANAAAAREYARVVSGVRRLASQFVGQADPLAVPIAEWLAARESEIDPGTLETYKGYAEREWLVRWPTLAELMAEGALTTFMTERLRVVLADTVTKELAAMSTFFDWCVEKRLITERPKWPELGRSKGTRARKRTVRELTVEQVEAILAALPEWSRCETFRVRDHWIVAYETGFRPATMSKLLVADLHLAGSEIVVRDEIDKARYGRTVPISARAKAALIRVTQERKRADVVFGAHDHRTYLRTASKAIGLDSVNPYDLRHARGTHLSDNGGAMTGVAFVLGHKQLTTTNRYAHPNKRAAFAAVNGGQSGGQAMNVQDLSGNDGDGYGVPLQSRGCPVVSVTASHVSLSGSTRFFTDVTTLKGTCVKARCHRPTTTSVFPAIAACTACLPSVSQKTLSVAFALTLRIM
jgi:integrase